MTNKLCLVTEARYKLDNVCKMVYFILYTLIHKIFLETFLFKIVCKYFIIADKLFVVCILQIILMFIVYIGHTRLLVLDWNHMKLTQR